MKYLDDNGLLYMWNKIKSILPTKTSSLANDSGFLTILTIPKEYVTDTELTGKDYQTSTQVESAITAKGYQTSTQVQTAINNSIGQMTGISFLVVASLPTTGVMGTIYLTPNSGSVPNIYDEYIWVESPAPARFEKIGTTAVDLTNYATISFVDSSLSSYTLKSDLVAITNAEIDVIIK